MRIATSQTKCPLAMSHGLIDELYTRTKCVTIQVAYVWQLNIFDVVNFERKKGETKACSSGHSKRIATSGRHQNGVLEAAEKHQRQKLRI